MSLDVIVVASHYMISPYINDYMEITWNCITWSWYDIALRGIRMALYYKELI